MKYDIGAGGDAKPVGGCRFCATVAQIGLNLFLLSDLVLNTLLLGTPLETVSQRAARARRAGSKPAAAFCAVLTWVWKHIFRSNHPDHCEWSLDGNGSIGRELWSWAGTTPPNPPPPPQDR